MGREGFFVVNADEKAGRRWVDNKAERRVRVYNLRKHGLKNRVIG